MSTEAKTQHLTIFLARDDIKDQSDIIRESQCHKWVELDLPEFGMSRLYIKFGLQKYPPWISLFENILDPNDVGKTNGVSAALPVKTSERFFVLAFGQGGRFLLNESAIEPRFGLLVTLNSVAAESLRCIDKQSLDNLESQSRIQSSYETTSDQFGIDIEQDMLKAVVGSPASEKLGSRMTGSDSLSVSVKTTIKSLGPLLDTYLEKFGNDLADKGYEWVNNISSIKTNSALILSLEEELNKKLQNKDFTNVWLSIPEIIPWDMVKGFVFTHGRKLIHPDITMEGFLTTVKDGNISVDLLKERKVFCADEDHRSIYRTWPVFRCLYAELDYLGAKYVLNDGKWFRVEPAFEKKTNETFSKIARSNLSLPTYQHKNEGEFNQDISASMPNEYALMDDKNKIFHGGGHGQVEVCDLFSAKKNLVHIKRYGKSSVLSHLFSQGFVSGQLLQLDSEFRKKFRAKLPVAFRPLINESSRPKDLEFTITFAVISEEQGKNLHLPFFSRVNMNNTCRILRGYGYKVELLKICVDPMFSRITIVPPEKAPKKRV